MMIGALLVLTVFNWYCAVMAYKTCRLIDQAVHRRIIDGWIGGANLMAGIINFIWLLYYAL
jgi:hypothetical protein